MERECLALLCLREALLLLVLICYQESSPQPALQHHIRQFIVFLFNLTGQPPETLAWLLVANICTCLRTIFFLKKNKPFNSSFYWKNIHLGNCMLLSEACTILLKCGLFLNCILYAGGEGVKSPHMVADCTVDLLHMGHGIWFWEDLGRALDRLQGFHSLTVTYHTASQAPCFVMGFWGILSSLCYREGRGLRRSCNYSGCFILSFICFTLIISSSLSAPSEIIHYHFPLPAGKIWGNQGRSRCSGFWWGGHLINLAWSW